MDIGWRAGTALLVAAVCLWGDGSATTAAAQPKPTILMRFELPAQLPHGLTAGSCEGSRVAGFRADTRRCAAGATVYDPCFVTANENQVVCNVDPRKSGSGLLVTASAPTTPAPAPQGLGHRAWFFELVDGTTCRPMAGPGRELDGLAELYTCQWGSDGQADAVLGELDDSQPTWTIRKVLINKKTEPQTLKSLSMAVVKSAWR